MSVENLILRQMVCLGGLPVPGTSQLLTDATGASQRSTALAPHQSYLICGDGPFYFLLGNASVTALAAGTSTFWPGSTPLVIFTGSNTNLAIIRSGGATTNISITRLDIDPEGPIPPSPGQFR